MSRFILKSSGRLKGSVVVLTVLLVVIGAPWVAGQSLGDAIETYEPVPQDTVDSPAAPTGLPDAPGGETITTDDVLYPGKNLSREQRIKTILARIDQVKSAIEALAGFSFPFFGPDFLATFISVLQEQIYVLYEQIRLIPPDPTEPPVSPRPPVPPVPPTPPATTVPPAASGTGPLPPAPIEPAAPPENEAEMAKRGKELIDELRKRGARPGVGRGDSPAARDIGGFPDWFCELQDLLCGRMVWTAIEEESRKLLGAFANSWCKANIPQPMHHALPNFFQYLGCTESNNAAIQGYNAQLPRSGEFGGSENQSNWCAWATNYNFYEPIHRAGYKMAGGRQTWSTNKKYINMYYAGHPNAKIEAGDYVATEKHVLTAIAVRGDKVLCISGNAGGGAKAYSGTVRIEEIPISRFRVVKKSSELSLTNIRAHENDEAWMRAHGLTKP